MIIITKHMMVDMYYKYTTQFFSFTAVRSLGVGGLVTRLPKSITPDEMK